jgi:UDP-N-acetylmuramoyl-tripeptide--D-alanyl-D-alanine ligase
MLFTTGWLSEIFTDHKGNALAQVQISEVTTDSRKETASALFIPLAGAHFDGHEYVMQALDNGAAAIIWTKDKPLPESIPADFPVFFADDTLAALQQLAAAYRNKVNPAVIGITGSNGKTTTKDIVSSVLKTAYKTHHTAGNFNNHIGLPLTILSMAQDTEMLVLEMGMSGKGEIETLSKIARPDYAIITNIGESHIEYLGSREAIADAKLEITEGMEEKAHLIIDGDEKLLKTPVSQQVTTCGYQQGDDFTIAETDVSPGETMFRLSDGRIYRIPLMGRHHALNATFAIALGNLLNIPSDKIKHAFRQLALTSMRFEMVKGKHGTTIINDAYNASPTSMKAAIQVVKQMDGYKEKVLILGDILELGNTSKMFHQSVADTITPPVTAVFTIGSEAKHISDRVQLNDPSITCMHMESKQALVKKLRDYENRNALLLFKASRGMRLEEIAEAVCETAEK